MFRKDPAGDDPAGRTPTAPYGRATNRNPGFPGGAGSGARTRESSLGSWYVTGYAMPAGWVPDPWAAAIPPCGPWDPVMYPNGVTGTGRASGLFGEVAGCPLGGRPGKMTGTYFDLSPVGTMDIIPGFPGDVNSMEARRCAVTPKPVVTVLARASGPKTCLCFQDGRAGSHPGLPERKAAKPVR